MNWDWSILDFKCLHCVWAAGRTSWSAGNHHTWLSKCQHSSHCQTSQRDALLGEKKTHIEMFVSHGVLWKSNFWTLHQRPWLIFRMDCSIHSGKNTFKLQFSRIFIGILLGGVTLLCWAQQLMLVHSGLHCSQTPISWMSERICALVSPLRYKLARIIPEWTHTPWIFQFPRVFSENVVMEDKPTEGSRKSTPTILLCCGPTLS